VKQHVGLAATATSQSHRTHQSHHHGLGFQPSVVTGRHVGPVDRRPTRRQRLSNQGFKRHRNYARMELDGDPRIITVSSGAVAWLSYG
jgi:hypothetical protein